MMVICMVKYDVRREHDMVYCPKTMVNRHIPKYLCEDCVYYHDFECKYRELYNPIKGMRDNDKSM